MAPNKALYKIGFRRALMSGVNVMVPKAYNSQSFIQGYDDGLKELNERRMHQLLGGDEVGLNDVKPRHIFYEFD